MHLWVSNAKVACERGTTPTIVASFYLNKFESSDFLKLWRRQTDDDPTVFKISFPYSICSLFPKNCVFSFQRPLTFPMPKQVQEFLGFDMYLYSGLHKGLNSVISGSLFTWNGLRETLIVVSMGVTRWFFERIPFTVVTLQYNTPSSISLHERRLAWETVGVKEAYAILYGIELLSERVTFDLNIANNASMYLFLPKKAKHDTT